MTFIKRTILFFVIGMGFLPLLAQKSIRDSSITMGHLSIVYSLGQPGGDLSDRFGLTNMIGGEGGVKLANGFYGYSGLKFVFGNVVKEAVARNVVQLIGTDSTGYQTMALGADGRYYTVRFFERGFVVPLMVGKIFTLSKKSNLNSGIYVELGTQFIQHKINVIAVGDNVPYLSKPYLKGYDRLTNGFGLVEGFGYRYFGNNRFTNFFIGAELSQNFTKNRRDLNFDTGVQDDRQRMDLLYNLKVGWTFPIYRSAPESEYYY
jgi:hypothetical protein